MWSNLRARAAVDCRETDQGDMREIVVGHVSRGESGSYRSKAILLSNAWGGAITIASLYPHTSFSS